MKDISRKDEMRREAVAAGKIVLKPSTIESIRRKEVEKGDALETAKVAGILAVKKTPELIPYCHPLNIDYAGVEFTLGDTTVSCKCTVRAFYRTGVEMEAITGVSAALLTLWDMVKYLEKDENGQYPTTSIDGIRVVSKVKGV